MFAEDPWEGPTGLQNSQSHAGPSVEIPLFSMLAALWGEHPPPSAFHCLGSVSRGSRDREPSVWILCRKWTAVT